MDLPVVLVEKENFGTRPLSIPILERKYCVITLYLLLDNVSKGKQYLSMKTLRAFSWFMCLPFVPKKQPAVDPLKLIGPKKSLLWLFLHCPLPEFMIGGDSGVLVKRFQRGFQKAILGSGGK